MKRKFKLGANGMEKLFDVEGEHRPVNGVQFVYVLFWCYQYAALSIEDEIPAEHVMNENKISVRSQSQPMAAIAAIYAANLVHLCDCV